MFNTTKKRILVCIALGLLCGLTFNYTLIARPFSRDKQALIKANSNTCRQLAVEYMKYKLASSQKTSTGSNLESVPPEELVGTEYIQQKCPIAVILISDQMIMDWLDKND